MGYFRIFYYITYILNFILRLLKRHGKQVLLFLCIAVFLVICLYSPKSQAIYIGNDTYTDGQNNVITAYDGVTMDFIRRFDLYKKKFPNSQALTEINGYLNALNFRNFYIYYNDKNGIAMLNGAPIQTPRMYLLIYVNNVPVNPSLYDDYLGNQCDIKELAPSSTALSAYCVYELSNQNSESSLRRVDNVSGDKFYIPSILINYFSSEFVDYFYNNYTLEEVEILHDMNNKLNQANQELQTQTDYMTEVPSSEDFSTSDLPTDSGVTNPTENGLNSFFNSFYNGFIAEPNYSQHTIRVPIPFTRQKV